MKTLITLILIISITVISWSSCAKNTQISTNNLYNQSSLSANPANLTASKPFLTNDTISESFVFIPNNVLNKHNFLFEITMIFNDKLQQLIAFFSRTSSKAKDVAVNDNQNTKKIMYNNENCKEST